MAAHGCAAACPLGGGQSHREQSKPQQPLLLGVPKLIIIKCDPCLVALWPHAPPKEGKGNAHEGRDGEAATLVGSRSIILICWACFPKVATNRNDCGPAAYHCNANRLANGWQLDSTHQAAGLLSLLASLRCADLVSVE